MSGIEAGAVRVGDLGEAPVRIRRNVVVGIGLWGIDVAREVMGRVERRGRMGLYVGMGGLRPGWDELMPRLEHQDGGPPWERGLGRFHPFWMLRNLSNNVQAVLASEFEIRDDGATFGGEVAGGLALHSALEALECGVIDQALVVAYDDLRTPEIRVERGGMLGAGAAAVVLGRDGPLIEPTTLGFTEESPIGAAHLVVRAVELMEHGGTAVQWARPGNRCGIRVG